MRYMTKAHSVEAMRFRDFDQVEELCEFVKPSEPEFFSDPDYVALSVLDQPTVLFIEKGDWIVKLADSMFVRLTDGEFHEHYAPVVGVIYL